MQRPTSGFSLVVAALALAACESPTVVDAPTDVSPSFAAVTTTVNVSVPIALGVFVPCAADGAGELVLMSGNLHSLNHVTVNDNGVTVVTHNQPQGVSGVGQTTGDSYQGTGVTRETFGGSFVNGQFSTTFVNNFRIIGQGPNNNSMMHATMHFTVNANGDLTATVDNATATCN